MARRKSDPKAKATPAEQLPAGQVKTDAGGRPVTDEGGRPVTAGGNK